MPVPTCDDRIVAPVGVGSDDSTTLAIAVRGNASSPVEVPLGRYPVVFVDPDDTDEPFWWPAVVRVGESGRPPCILISCSMKVIPASEADEHMPQPNEGEFVVRYFEDTT